MIKKVITSYLRALVKLKLRRTKPVVIGITGSFGKTSTKDAVYTVLSTRYRVGKSSKSLNTDIGLLLAVLEQPSGFSSPLAWIKISVRAFLNAFLSRRYDYLVLEYGADKPGDIAELVRIVPPQIAIITHIARVHQAHGQFKNLDAVFAEKRKLVDSLPKNGTAILNQADVHIAELMKLKTKTLWYNGSDLRADELVNQLDGFLATIHYGREKITAHFSIPGAYHIDVLLPALLVGVVCEVPLAVGIRALKEFQLPPGRMSLIEGVHGSTLLDGSYNASPETTKEALRLLEDMPAQRRVAVLGNMNELGEFSAEAHRDVGAHCGPWIDLLITVGKEAKWIGEAALKKGLIQDRIVALTSAEEAVEVLKKWGLKKGDVILFKGSQNKVRLERAVKALMKHPSQAKKLLCRQEGEWEKI